MLELGLPSFNTLMHNYVVHQSVMLVLLTGCQRATVFVFNVFCSCTCNVHGALHAIFSIFFCSVDFLLFCLCLCRLCVDCVLFRMDPSGLIPIQNRWMDNYKLIIIYV